MSVQLLLGDEGFGITPHIDSGEIPWEFVQSFRALPTNSKKMGSKKATHRI